MKEEKTPPPRIFKCYLHKCLKILGDDPLQIAGKRPTIFTPHLSLAMSVVHPKHETNKSHTYTFLPSTTLCYSYFTLPNHRSGHKQTSQLCTFKIKLSIQRQRLRFAHLNACRLAKVSMHTAGFTPGRLECVPWFSSIRVIPSSHQYCTLHCLFFMHTPAPPSHPSQMSNFTTNTRTAQLPSFSTYCKQSTSYHFTFLTPYLAFHFLLPKGQVDTAWEPTAAKFLCSCNKGSVSRYTLIPVFLFSSFLVPGFNAFWGRNRSVLVNLAYQSNKSLNICIQQQFRSVHSLSFNNSETPKAYDKAHPTQTTCYSFLCKFCSSRLSLR